MAESGYNKDLDVVLYEKEFYRREGDKFNTMLAATIYSYNGSPPKISISRYSEKQEEGQVKKIFAKLGRFNAEELEALVTIGPKLQAKLAKYTAKVSGAKELVFCFPQ